LVHEDGLLALTVIGFDTHPIQYVFAFDFVKYK